MNEQPSGDRLDTVSRIRSVSQRLTDGTRAVVDAALDRVFDEPCAVPTPAEFERLMLDHHAGAGDGGGPGTLASAGAIAAFVKAATPFAERMSRHARAGTNAAGKAFIPARVAKYAPAVIPVAMSLTAGARRGVHEIQVLASYLVHRLREAGLEPDRGLVRTLTMSLVLDPERRPRLDTGSPLLSARSVRQWIFRSIGNDSAQAVRARAHAQLAAIERLDLPELAERWAQRRG